jgi:hypothetical protein
MSQFHKDIVEELVRNWDVAQLSKYILELEERVDNTKEMIRDLKTLRRRRTRKSLENGERGGK